MSYHAMTAHVSIVLARCMLLSLEQRRKIDKRSIGELFYVSCDELQDLQYIDALIMVSSTYLFIPHSKIEFERLSTNFIISNLVIFLQRIVKPNATLLKMDLIWYF